MLLPSAIAESLVVAFARMVTGLRQIEGKESKMRDVPVTENSLHVVVVLALQLCCSAVAFLS